MWTPEMLPKAGLTDAVNTGVFTTEQHAAFMSVAEKSAASGGRLP